MDTGVKSHGIDSLSLVDTTANPAPLGLLGFGMTTVLLNVHNAGVTALDGTILAMGIFYGGLAQLIAGIMEWRKKNTFGTTAFASYGMFWLSLVGLVVMPRLGWSVAPSPIGMSIYLILWGIFTTVMFVATFLLNRALQVVFGTLAALFFILAIGELSGSTVITRIGGVEGIVCGLSAVYTGLAQVLNEVYGRSLLPLGPVVHEPTVRREPVVVPHSP